MDSITTPRSITCKLTGRELQQRKKDVVASLQSKIITSRELIDGFEYEFHVTDEIIDELSSFIKTERQCCDFFEFVLRITGEHAWLSIKGPLGAKEFLITEIGFKN